MAVLQLFATPEEVAEILRELSEAHQLEISLYEGGAFVPVPSTVLSGFGEAQAPSRVFLYPAEAAPSTVEVLRPRDLGWIDVAIGSLVETSRGPALTMSTIQVDDPVSRAFKPAAWVRKLRRSLEARWAFGARGVNIVHGGSHDYRDIGYSPRAAELFRQGVRWKQFATDNAEFSPLAAEPRGAS